MYESTACRFLFFTKPISLWKNKENNTLVLSTISCTYYIMIKMLLQGQRD